MGAGSEQTVSEELTQRIAELIARVAELSRRLDLIEVVRGNGRGHPHTEPVVHGADDSSSPIEFSSFSSSKLSCSSILRNCRAR